MPTGWNDELDVPVHGRHFFLDTGIYHNLAGLDDEVRSQLRACIAGHERNATIFSEVATQKEDPLFSQNLAILKFGQDCQSDSCTLDTDHARVETIRNELIADAERRHPDFDHSLAGKSKHGGEAELIHRCELHEPKGVIVCNDAGASAVAFKNGVDSIHFVHTMRAAVRMGLPPSDALSALPKALAVSRLPKREEKRTCNEAWLR